jgi:hypothetical protein
VLRSSKERQPPHPAFPLSKELGLGVLGLEVFCGICCRVCFVGSLFCWEPVQHSLLHRMMITVMVAVAVAWSFV